MATILLVGSIAGGVINWRLAPPPAVVTVDDDDLDALIDEVYAKPGLGVEDSAGLFDLGDPVEDAYLMGRADFAAGAYKPVSGSDAEHDAYIRGYNDAWAAKNAVGWWRKGQRNA